ncbi:uncharacterized protein LOC121378272 [Gigantopelta aegis]|uniref:uncharacterized protein LOC121378272 n=1 Tax=Gigantopelta aegis TaxID=1735272 RepID=UPI001B88BB55|nr:uncharacterized protein LOC121378272 [Gigantopelta aegis]
MNIFSSCFVTGKHKRKSSQYSAKSAVLTSPPVGRVTEKDDPNLDIWKDQFSTGDQTDTSRIAFYNSGLAACVKCGEKNIGRFEEKAGIRANGETFGTEVFLCQTKGCKWETSFKFDDGHSGAYHFETAEWVKGIAHFPVSFMMMWARKHNLPDQVCHQIFENRIDGNTMLRLIKEDKLAATLDTDRKTVKKILNALKKENSTILL